MRKLFISFLLLASTSVAFASTPHEKTIDKLNSLLRGELSAVETYRQALEKVGDEPEAAKIKLYQENHKEAVQTLRQEVANLGGKPSTDSGSWGVWARTVQGTAKLFGDAAALKALKEGEEHGLKEYQEALAAKDIDGQVKEKISKNMIPQQQEHIAGIDSMISSID